MHCAAQPPSTLRRAEGGRDVMAPGLNLDPRFRCRSSAAAAESDAGAKSGLATIV